jgi:hypothetical protein
MMERVAPRCMRGGAARFQPARAGVRSARTRATRPPTETKSRISLPIATAVSAMRFEKPHSLSYQDRIEHEVAVHHLGLVHVEDDEAGLWLKSIETFGSVRVAEQCPSAGRRGGLDRGVDLFDDVVARLAMNFRSTTETFGVGTRMEKPSSLPLSSGSTRPTALAAPSRSGSSTAPRRGRDRDPCASCPASAGRRCRSGSWSSCPSRCRWHRAAPWRPAQAVGGARGVRDDHVILGQLVVVDAIDDRQVGAVARAETARAWRRRSRWARPCPSR